MKAWVPFPVIFEYVYGLHNRYDLYSTDTISHFFMLAFALVLYEHGKPLWSGMNTARSGYVEVWTWFRDFLD